MAKGAYLIYNPLSGSASSPELWLGQVVHSLCAVGYEVATIALTGAVHSDAIVERLKQGCDLLVAAGGDGTIRLALEASARSMLHVPVGIIPAGTGNQLARNLGIYEDNILADPLDKAIQTLIDGKVFEMDLGVMNGNYFAVAAGAGPMSDAILSPEQNDKINWRMFAYASSLVQTLAQPPTLFEITADGESFSVAASGIFVTNISELGMGALSETALLDDGILDLCVLAPQEFQDYLDVGFRFVGGIGGEQAAYYVKKVTSVDIKVLPVSRHASLVGKTWRRIKNLFGVNERPALVVHKEATAMIDGDACGTTPMHIEVAPRIVSVLVPRSLKLSRTGGDAK